MGVLADAEPLMALPAAPYPATNERSLPVGSDATVAFRGNRYSVPPGLVGSSVTLRHRLGSPTVELQAASGTLLAVHRLGQRVGLLDDPQLVLRREARLAGRSGTSGSGMGSGWPNLRPGANGSNIAGDPLPALALVS